MRDNSNGRIYLIKINPIRHMITMKKKCDNCAHYHHFLGAEYCLFDKDTDFWEIRRKDYELMCDRFISKNSSFEEEMEYLKKRRSNSVKIELWKEPTEEEKEEEELGLCAGLSKSDIYEARESQKARIAIDSEFIKKYPVLNPDYPGVSKRKKRVR
ncbi:MAG: hypothetical protein ACFFCC_20200 [Promethearchaeota archaeon]